MGNASGCSPAMGGESVERALRRWWHESLDDLYGGARLSSPVIYTPCHTSETLAAIGVPGDVLWCADAGHFKTVIAPFEERGHEIQREVLERLPELADGVVAAWISMKRDRVCLLVPEVDKRGDPILVAARPFGYFKCDGVKHPCVYVISMYGKRDIVDMLVAATKGGDLLYLDADATSRLLARSGRKLPSFVAARDGLCGRLVRVDEEGNMVCEPMGGRTSPSHGLGSFDGHVESECASREGSRHTSVGTGCMRCLVRSGDGRCTLFKKKMESSLGCDSLIPVQWAEGAELTEVVFDVSWRSLRTAAEADGCSAGTSEQQVALLSDYEIADTYELVFGDAVRRRESSPAWKSHHSPSERLGDGKGYLTALERTRGRVVAYELEVTIRDGLRATQRSEGREACLERVLRQTYEDFWHTFSRFEVSRATMSADRDMPRLSICFVPWSDGYPHGQDTQTSFDRALESMGIVSEGKTVYVGKASKHRLRALLNEMVERALASEGIAGVSTDAVGKTLKERGPEAVTRLLQTVAKYATKEREEENGRDRATKAKTTSEEAACPASEERMPDVIGLATSHLLLVEGRPLFVFSSLDAARGARTMFQRGSAASGVNGSYEVCESVRWWGQ